MPLKSEASSCSRRDQAQDSPKCIPLPDLAHTQSDLPTGLPNPPKRKRHAQDSNSRRKSRKMTRYDHRFLAKPIEYWPWTEAEDLLISRGQNEIRELVRELVPIRHGTSAFIPKVLKVRRSIPDERATQADRY